MKDMGRKVATKMTIIYTYKEEILSQLQINCNKGKRDILMIYHATEFSKNRKFIGSNNKNNSEKLDNQKFLESVARIRFTFHKFLHFRKLPLFL